MKDLISRYVWIVDTLSHFNKLTREEINRLWMQSDLSDGNPIPERTFFYYRRAIEENFHIDIRCNRAGEYYIDEESLKDNQVVINWLLESYTVNSAMKDSNIPQERVAVEDVPSAREFLPRVLTAIGRCTKIVFTYSGFSRTRPEAGIRFRPYFVKRYKQRWYMVGLREKSGDIRTYALDRVTALEALAETFEMPEDMTPARFFENMVGITVSKAPIRTVRIRVTPTQAKYFRALPFHETQQEELHDSYSIFTYRLKLNYELVHELLSYGDSVKVLEPRELILMLTDQLRDTLALYS